MALPNTDETWVGRRPPPLFWQQTTDLKIEVKLANMRVTINQGADVDELDTEPDAFLNYGRPLHFASDITHIEFKNLKDNLDVIKLLLEKGADPRKPGMMYTDSALEEVKFSLKSALRNGRFQKEWKDVIPFLRDAYEKMKEAADRLDAEDGMFFRLSG
jgi:hypothetical protein